MDTNRYKPFATAAAWLLVSIFLTSEQAPGTGGLCRCCFLASAFVFPSSSPLAAQKQSNLRKNNSNRRVFFFASREETTPAQPISSSSSADGDNHHQTEDKTTTAVGDFSFFDEASIYVRAGSGGQGSSTYKKAKKGANGIPDGGSGGIGGDVVLRMDPSLNTLAGLGFRALRPNAFGGGGAAASSKRTGGGYGGDNNNSRKKNKKNHQKKQKRNNNNGSDDNSDDSKKAVESGGVGSSTDHRSPSSRERLLSFRAKDGTAGGRMYDNGRKGEDCEVLVPPGTVVQMEVARDDDRPTTEEEESSAGSDADADSDNSKEDGPPPREVVVTDLVDIGTISRENPALIVAKGGRGGEGTATLKGKKKGATRRGPEGGERGTVKLTLKIVADIALVGVPNAGKSTFLSAVTRAKPRIADCPFTTVVPNLGTWIPLDSSRGGTAAEASNNNNNNGGNGLVLCDVPGLIAGASEGVGLGHAFLRHIERCRVILHLVDATSDDPVADYAMVNDELKYYGSGSLSKKPQVVVINKIDAAFGDDDDDDASFEQQKAELATRMKQEMGHTRLLWVSAKEKKGVDDLMLRMASYVGKMKKKDDEE